MGTGWNILIAILASVGVMSVVFLGYLVIRSISAGSRKKSRAGNSAVKKKKHETMKMVVWVCLANGFAWVWCSYVLAFLDKMQIAESLSQVAVTQIIGVVLVYARKGFIKPGVYTIVEESTGAGASKWGKLKSGAGWVSLDYCTKM